MALFTAAPCRYCLFIPLSFSTCINVAVDEAAVSYFLGDGTNEVTCLSASFYLCISRGNYLFSFI